METVRSACGQPLERGRQDKTRHAMLSSMLHIIYRFVYSLGLSLQKVRHSVLWVCCSVRPQQLHKRSAAARAGTGVFSWIKFLQTRSCCDVLYGFWCILFFKILHENVLIRYRCFFVSKEPVFFVLMWWFWLNSHWKIAASGRLWYRFVCLVGV